MILLDTNIISEMMKAKPNVRVQAWLDEQEIVELYISSITIAEITYGIQCLSDGPKKRALAVAFNKTLKEAFKHRVLYFDELAAHETGKVMARKKELGHAMSFQDGQIAGIAVCHGAVLGTRNTKDFSDCDLELINPF